MWFQTRYLIPDGKMIDAQEQTDLPATTKMMGDIAKYRSYNNRAWKQSKAAQAKSVLCHFSSSLSCESNLLRFHIIC